MFLCEQLLTFDPCYRSNFLPRRQRQKRARQLVLTVKLGGVALLRSASNARTQGIHPHSHPVPGGFAPLATRFPTPAHRLSYIPHDLSPVDSQPAFLYDLPKPPLWPGSEQPPECPQKRGYQHAPWYPLLLSQLYPLTPPAAAPTPPPALPHPAPQSNLIIPIRLFIESIPLPHPLSSTKTTSKSAHSASPLAFPRALRPFRAQNRLQQTLKINKFSPPTTPK